MSFDAGAITGSLGLDLSEYARGMLQAEGIASLFPHVVTEFIANPLLGVISAAQEMAHALKDAFVDVAHDAASMGKAAEQAGVSVEFLSTLGKAGAGVEAIGDGLKFLGKNLVDAAAAGPEGERLRGVFEGLGISAKDLTAALGGGEAGMEQLFYKVGDGIRSLGSGAEKTKAAMELLGRGGVDLIPQFNKGSAALKEYQGQIAELGGVVTKEEAGMGRSFGKIETLIGAAFEGIKKAVTEPLFEVFGQSIDEITENIKAFAGEIRQGVAVAIDVLRPLVTGLWEAFKGLGSTVGSVIAPAFTLLIPVLKVVAEILGGLFELIGKILSGIGSIVSGVTDALGITSSSPTPTPAAGKGGNSGGVTVENVNVSAIDADKASTAMAAKISPQIRAATAQQKGQIEQAAKGAKVSRAVRGK